MANPKRDNAKAARILVDAALLGDRKACEKHGITSRTMRNYRSALDDDPELSALYAELSAKVSTLNWAAELDKTLSIGIRKMGELINKASKPSELGTVSQAVQGLAEIALTREVLNAENSAENSDHSHPHGEDQAPAHLPN